MQWQSAAAWKPHVLDRWCATLLVVPLLVAFGSVPTLSLWCGYIGLPPFWLHWVVLCNFFWMCLVAGGFRQHRLVAYKSWAHSKYSFFGLVACSVRVIQDHWHCFWLPCQSGKVATCRRQPIRVQSIRFAITKTCMKPFWLFLAVLLCPRIGEAKVPGPPSSPTWEMDDHEVVSHQHSWSLGTCNPSGLPNKAHLIAHSSVDVWAVAETHLSIQGTRLFRRQLAMEQSQFKWCVTGHPVVPRSTLSNHGSWSGVGILARHPSRQLPHVWPEHVYETSRIVCGATFLNNFWLTGVSMYGLPIGPTHPQTKAKTNLLLTAAIQRLLLQDGPRYLAGDFNHDLCDLPAIQVLLDQHFVEVQDLFYHQTGILPKPTCKGKTRRDYLFLSRELVPMFRTLEIDPLAWPDHATLVAHFQGSAVDLIRYPWPKPNQLDWRISQDADPLQVIDFEQAADCTLAYSQFWAQVESRHVTAAQAKGFSVPFRCCGRGQRLKPNIIRGSVAPTKKGRNGEFQPKFFGLSLVHCHWVKQVRRFQSFVRVINVHRPSEEHRNHTICLWQAIMRAPGFAPSFAVWWTHRNLAVGEPSHVPEYPPTLEVAVLIFEAVKWETSVLEATLNQKHQKRSSVISGNGMAQVYASVRRDAPQPVEVLLQSLTSKVSALDTDTVAIEIDPPQCFDPTKPLRCGPQKLEPIVVTEDKIWLPHLDDIKPGDLVIQDQFQGNLHDIFNAFTDQWTKRWHRHADLPLSHWDGILQFANRHLGRVVVAPPQFSVPQIRATVTHKKAKAATGLDGVSRQDVISLGPNGLQTLVSLFKRAHKDGEWPRQLLQGQITSLAKKPSPAGPEDYRPITVFSIIFRVWSTIISRFWIQHLSTIVDERLFGNRANCRAANLWRCILDEIEFAQCNQASVCGLVVDLEKAFNTLPRKVTLGFAALAGLDQGSLCAWAGALGSMERRFAVMGSLSPPVTSSCGFAEGCGMSVVAMMLIDEVWHRWVQVQYQLCRPMSFVDNWEIVTNSPEAIDRVFRATLAFAEQMDLSIDRNKTFVWAVHPQHRRDLRSRNFNVQLDHADLGAHLTYSKQTRNASLVARFLGLTDFWDKLRRCGGSFACKARAVASAAWPRAMHGISATWVSLKHLHSLRARYMSAMRLDKPGANSFLQLHLDGFGMDPMAYAVLQTIRDFRDLGSSDWHVALLDEITQLHTQGGRNTVTRVLQQRVELLGWSFEGRDVVLDDLGAFSLSGINWAELCLRLQRSWHKYVHAQISHRSDFAGFQHVAFGATRKLVSTLSPFDQGVCRRNMNGSTLTNEHACYWSSSGSHLCRFCNKPDSLNHRYWECTASSDLREKLGTPTLQAVVSLPPVSLLRSWQLQSTRTDDWWRYLVSIPSGAPEPAVALPSDGTLDLFTDGSAFWQSSPEFRLAAWSICLAQAPTMSSSNWETNVVAAGPVSGLVQTSFRAELTAVTFAIQYMQDDFESQCEFGQIANLL